MHTPLAAMTVRDALHVQIRRRTQIAPHETVAQSEQAAGGGEVYDDALVQTVHAALLDQVPIVSGGESESTPPT